MYKLSHKGAVKKAGPVQDFTSSGSFKCRVCVEVFHCKANQLGAISELSSFYAKYASLWLHVQSLKVLYSQSIIIYLPGSKNVLTGLIKIGCVLGLYWPLH